MRYVLIIFTVVFMLGCIPYSDSPLTDPLSDAMDSSICGTWFWKDENETGYIHIGLDEETKLLKVIMLDIGNDDEMDVAEFTGHTSLLIGNKYLNLKWVRGADNYPGYIFIKYEISQGVLGLSLMDTDVVVKAIGAGVLEGEVKKGDWIFSTHITETQKKLQQFVLKHDRELFKEMKFLPKFESPDMPVPALGENIP